MCLGREHGKIKYSPRGDESLLILPESYNNAVPTLMLLFGGHCSNFKTFVLDLDSITMGNKRSRNPYNLAVVAFVALGSLAFGYAASIISTTLAQPSFMFVYPV